ncbi:murein tripeptide amidase MpaA [Fibrobacter sp.]|uniref:murein tripeptide amidase MpaA n=1 Tax=Fibrobacter sp. TaxID=35828 RepID=UPI0025C71AE6|nr:murein tripeptide amidase MpaA [Fibrobacter sp.]
MMALDLSPDKRGVIRLKPETYGRSVLGAPLQYYPASGSTELLVVAGIHGEEPETTFLLSRALRHLPHALEHTAVVLCANPDGMVMGTRGNESGVDLNRNFATSNWKPGSVGSRSVLERDRDTLLSTGTAPASEPETCALVKLVKNLRPRSILSIHAPLGCVDAPERTPLVAALQDVFGLPWVPDVGYETPGSLGTWCNENGTECVTLELPRMSLEMLYDRYGEAFAQFLAQPVPH